MKIHSDHDFGGIARAVNLLNPVSAQDAATKAYVDGSVAEGTVFGRAIGAGTGARGDLTGAQQGEAIRFATNQTEATGGTFAPFVLTSKAIKRLVVTATSTFHGFAMVTSGTQLENGMEFVVENGGAIGSGITVSFVQFSSTVAGGNPFKILLQTNFGTDVVGVILQPGESQVFRYTDNPGVANSLRVRAVGPKTLASVITAGTSLGRSVTAGNGVPTPLTGIQQGENLRRSTVVTDNLTTGVVATYPIAEGTTHIIFTGSGAIQLEGATIIAGKEIVWSVDFNASVVVTFMNDGAPTITQERFRTPTQRQMTIRAGESVTTSHSFNRHRFISVSKRIDPQLTSVVREDFDGQCDAAGVLARSPWIAWDAPTIAQVDNATSGFHSANHPGVLHMQADAALADECAIYRGPWDFANIATFGASIMVPADGGNELLNCALGFAIVSDPTDMDVSPSGGLWTDNMLGVMVRSGGASPGLWLLRRENAGAGAAVSSGVTVVAGTWATFRCEQTTPGSGSWRCYINGTLFTTATLANTSGIAYLAVGLIRGAGTAGRNLLIDEIFLDTFELNRAAA